jgi:cytochrome bd-type quinol oxidase subunit 2
MTKSTQRNLYLRTPNSFRWLMGMTAAVIIILMVLLIFFRDENLRTVLYNIASPFQSILVAGMLFFTARLTATTKPKQAEAWRLWAFVFAFYALGDICWIILQVLLKVEPSRSISDLFYSLSYIFLCLGLMRYPADNFSTHERSQLKFISFVPAHPGRYSIENPGG